MGNELPTLEELNASVPKKLPTLEELNSGAVAPTTEAIEPKEQLLVEEDLRGPMGAPELEAPVLPASTIKKTGQVPGRTPATHIKIPELVSEIGKTPSMGDILDYYRTQDVENPQIKSLLSGVSEEEAQFTFKQEEIAKNPNISEDEITSKWYDKIGHDPDIDSWSLGRVGVATAIHPLLGVGAALLEDNFGETLGKVGGAFMTGIRQDAHSKKWSQNFSSFEDDYNIEELEKDITYLLQD